MNVSIRITDYRDSLTADALLLVRDTTTQITLKQKYVPNWFKAPHQKTWMINLSGSRFATSVGIYAEVDTQDPWKDVELYFNNSAIVAGSPLSKPLAGWAARYPMLNKDAMAAAAEALAGWFCEEKYGWRLLRRPQRVTPDLIFYDPKESRFALVEVKSTGPRGKLMTNVTKDMIKLLQHLSMAKPAASGPYYGVLIKVRIVDSAQIELLSLRLEEV